MSDDEQRRSLRKRVLGRAAGLITRTKVGSADAARDLMIEAQRATYREMHRRFTERAARGEGGLQSGLEAMDAMWMSIRQLRSGAPTIVHTISSHDDRIAALVEAFFLESTELLEDAIRAVFAADLGQLTVPPDRMAVLLRIAFEGLIVELAKACNADDVATVDHAYADLRMLFERFALDGAQGPMTEPLSMEPIPLPW
jgi:hypothetical protein